MTNHNNGIRTGFRGEMGERGWIAEGSQPKSPLAPDAMLLGEELYERVCAGDKTASEQLRQLARASELGERPVEVEEE
jgi:hypothetical protein